MSERTTEAPPVPESQTTERDSTGLTVSTAAIVGKGFRADIQGLRAVAVVSVVLAHAGVAGVAGGFIGVDLFFVLSGFLITGLLVREWEKNGRIAFSQFWSRRVRRLLPASAFVLVSTAIASYIFLPPAWRISALTDIVWSAFFAANWRFAITRADYFAENSEISPLLHFWSLGVEEQYYFVWPFLIFVAGTLAVWLGRNQNRQLTIRTTVAWLSGAVIVFSFGYSLWVLQTNQPLAYFGTFTRVWQLAVGAFLAAVGPGLQRYLRSIALRNVYAIIGALGFLGSIVVLAGKDAGNYPGWTAVVPTLSAALLIVAGNEGGRHLLVPFLELRPMQWLGDVSYSLYLWHFPVLIIGFYVFAPAGWLVTTGLVLGSVVLAGLTYIWIETPPRTSLYLKHRPGMALLLGALLVVTAAGTATGLLQITQSRIDKTINNEGQSVILQPSLLDPRQKRNPIFEGCRSGFEEIPLKECLFGDINGEYRAFLIGDSLASNLFEVMTDAAELEGWKINTFTKPGCTPADVTVYNEPRKVAYEPCDEFREKVITRALEAQTDVVFLVNGRNDSRRVVDRNTGELLSKRESAAEVADGWRSTIERFTDQGIKVIIIEGWPRVPHQPVECLMETGDARECGFDQDLDSHSVEVDVASEFDNVDVLSLDHRMCDDGACRVVDGDTLVYYDPMHVTAEFSFHFIPDFREALRAAE